MTPFADIWTRAVARKGEDELLERMADPKSPDELAATPDDRYLSAMAKRVFAAGFVWRVIEAKWPGFEEAFEGFDPGPLAEMGPELHELLLADRRIVRNGQKIRAVADNARFVREIAAEHGRFGRFLGDWPDDDTVGLWNVLKKRGARLGGTTGPLFLRWAGKDTFVLTPDVVHCLVREGVVTKPPTSQRDLQAVQEAFNGWRAESGRPHNHVSMTLACSVDGPGWQKAERRPRPKR